MYFCTWCAFVVLYWLAVGSVVVNKIRFEEAPRHGVYRLLTMNLSCTFDQILQLQDHDLHDGESLQILWFQIHSKQTRHGWSRPLSYIMPGTGGEEVTVNDSVAILAQTLSLCL